MGPELTRAVLNLAHNAFVSLDLEGRITEWNPRAEEIFGYSRAEALGQELAELIVPEHHREAHRAGLERALRRDPAGGALPVGRMHVEALRRDGTQFPVDVSVLSAPSEHEAAFHGWIQDVSEQAELLADLEAQLRGERPGFAEILDALAEAVTIRDAHNHVLYANRAALEMMGFSSLEELQRRTLHDVMDDYLVHDEHGNELAMEDIPSVRLLSGEPAHPLVMRIIHRETGRTRWQLLKASALHDRSGALVASVMVMEDVTEEKTTEFRDRFLAQATETLMSSLDYEQTLRNVAELAVPELADWCAVDLVDDLGRRQRVTVAHQDPSKLALARRLREYEPEIPNPESGLGKVLRQGIAEIYQDIPEAAVLGAARSEEHARLLLELELRSVVIVPLRARGRTLGAITLVTAGTVRRLQMDDLEFAQALADRAAVAVDNARLATARRQTASTLQRSLLPVGVPEIGGWEVATLYRPAGGVEEVEVGGDFYDFVETSSGWLVLLGDVAGKGAEAAAMTSLMRHGARFIGRDETSPSRILSRLNEALREQTQMWLVTAVCARLEQECVVLSSAGHPEPLVVRADGAVRELGVGGPILGAWSQVEHVETTVELSGDETLVLYTDGVLDTRAGRSRFGLDRLREALRQCASCPPEELLEELERSLGSFQEQAPTDDTAAVALRPRSPGNGHASRATAFASA